MVDYIVVGSGFSGAVVAERIATQLHKKVLVIDKNCHIGGSCYDSYDEKGILIHNYGPHIFHTKFPEVWQYLSDFSRWNVYQHKVLGLVDGQKVPIPFNLTSMHRLLPGSLASRLETKLTEKYGYNVKVPILELRRQDDADLKFLADFVYEKVFLHYTKKQWGLLPEDLDPAVTSRVPIYISYDDSYFQNEFQGMPKEGYTKIFEKMLFHSNIKLLLNTNYREVLDINMETSEMKLFGNPFGGKLIFTGQIDELFNFCFGELPYRSVFFDFETHDKEKYQEVCTINYPNNYTFTRITEFKHMTNQESKYTTILSEYPKAYERQDSDNIPLYPVPQVANFGLYQKYLKEADKLKNIYLLGRLADYKYYDMDITIARALEVFNKIIETK